MDTVPTDQTLQTEQSLPDFEDKPDDDKNSQIQDVWYSNFFEAMDTIISLVDDYPYISMVSASAHSPQGHRVPRHRLHPAHPAPLAALQRKCLRLTRPRSSSTR